MIGGFGPESTLDYYRLLIETYREKFDNTSYPEILIYSLDINKLLDMVAEKQWNELAQWLSGAINALYRAGADFAFISANTPHIVFDRVKQLSPIPLISIIEAARNTTLSLELKKVGLLGTLFTMQSKFYQEVFERENIEIVVPDEEEQHYIHSKLMTEIEIGIFKNETREGLLKIIRRMKDEEGIKGVILGCTELPLILTREEFDMRFINPAISHVESILKYCIE
jgi:aspartate racemase